MIFLKFVNVDYSLVFDIGFLNTYLFQIVFYYKSLDVVCPFMQALIR